MKALLNMICLLGTLLACVLLLLPLMAHADRLQDMADIGGVRNNQLIGYGLLVGLDGTGDKATSSPFTTQTMQNMLNQMGVHVPAGTTLDPKNTASVIVTAVMPPFVRPGQPIDVVVSSLGDAKSLRGGTLLMTPLKGVDGQIYAMAQGNVMVGGAGASANGSSAKTNTLNGGRIPDGAIVERQIPAQLGGGDVVQIELNSANFNNALRVEQAINAAFGGNVARAVDGRMVEARAPVDPDQRVQFIARLQDLNVTPEVNPPLVVINARTGSIVMNQSVKVDPCAVAHGNLTVTVSTSSSVSQPSALSNGQTVTTQQSDIGVKSDGGRLVSIPKGTNLNEIIRGLNAIGATPQDLLSILQAMKAAGALKAELQVI